MEKQILTETQPWERKWITVFLFALTSYLLYQFWLPHKGIETSYLENWNYHNLLEIIPILTALCAAFLIWEQIKLGWILAAGSTMYLSVIPLRFFPFEIESITPTILYTSLTLWLARSYLRREYGISKVGLLLKLGVALAFGIGYFEVLGWHLMPDCFPQDVKVNQRTTLTTGIDAQNRTQTLYFSIGSITGERARGLIPIFHSDKTV